MKALVLSAGGMFGAWQAGAWQAMQKVFRPDIVIGASIGSINGWVIASGCPAEELIGRWRQPMMDSEPKWRFPLFPLRSLADPGPVEEVIRTIHSAYRPRISYGVVVTEAPRLRPRVFTSATEITWRHLMASCAVPLIFPPYRLPDQRSYVDGGVLGSLPLWAAVELGATEVIAVDVWVHLPAAYSSVIGFLRGVAGHRPKFPAHARVTLIQPAAALGRPEDAFRWKAANVDRWIAQGREAAERALRG